MKKLLIILLIPLLLTACNEKKDNAETEKNATKVESEQERDKIENDKVIAEEEEKNKTENQEVEKNEGEEENDKQNDSAQVKLSEKELTEYSKKTTDFIENIDPSYAIVYEDFYDYNMDGKMEAVVFAQDMDNIREVYFLNVEGEQAELLSQSNILNLSDDSTSNDIIYDTAGSIPVEGFAYPIPFIASHPNPQLNGFRFYHLEDDYIDYFEDTLPMSDQGTTELIDSDNDGDYDLYEVSQSGYDVFYYPLTIRYAFDPSLLILFESGSIELGDYPDNPKDLVKEYIFLSYIRDYNRNQVDEFTDIENLDERLAEISSVEFDPQYVFSHDLLTNLAIEIPDGTEIVDKTHENDAVITVSPAENNQKADRATKFTLKKEEGKWHILNIEQL